VNTDEELFEIIADREGYAPATYGGLCLNNPHSTPYPSTSLGNSTIGRKFCNMLQSESLAFTIVNLL
jgi:hypothetical protein